MNPDDPLGLISSPKAQQNDPLGLITPTHHNKPKIGQMGHAITTDESVEAPNRRLGVIAALNRDIPGAEALQAGVRSVVRGQSYTDARNDIRGAEDAAPWQATLPARLLGGVASAAAIPGGPVLQGARFGALSGLGQSDPTWSAKDRIRSGGEGMAVGALAGSIFPAAKAAGATVKGTYRTVRDIGGILHGNPAAAVRLGRRAAPGIRQFLQEASRSAPEAAPAVEAVAPSTGSDVVEAVKAAKQPHRTIAQFQNFAERMGAEPQKPQTLSGQLHGLLNRLRTSQPEETGNTWGDAEEAMGLAPHQQPDLEALLKASLKKENVPSAESPAVQAVTKAKAPRRTTVANAVDPKYHLDTDEALLSRVGELSGRLEEYSSGEHGAPQFVRSDVPVSTKSSDQNAQVLGGNPSGYLSKPIVGGTRVASRMDQDRELYNRSIAELKARGWNEDDISAAVDERAGMQYKNVGIGLLPLSALQQSLKAKPNN